MTLAGPQGESQPSDEFKRLPTSSRAAALLKEGRSPGTNVTPRSLSRWGRWPSQARRKFRRFCRGPFGAVQSGFEDPGRATSPKD